jgi:hypothetical protein
MKSTLWKESQTAREIVKKGKKRLQLDLLASCSSGLHSFAGRPASVWAARGVLRAWNRDDAERDAERDRATHIFRNLNGSDEKITLLIDNERVRKYKMVT